MAESFIEDIYRYSRVIYELQRVVKDIRLFFDDAAIFRLDSIFPELCELCKMCISTNLESGKELWDKVMALTTIKNDLIELGDQIDIEVVPCLKRIVSNIADINVDVDDDYAIRSSQSGYLTLYSKKFGLYLHGKDNPMLDAMEYVSSFYDGSKEEYYVFGCGLGYEVYQLFDLSDSFTRIILYEPDERIYEMACSYGALSMIPREYLSRIRFENAADFLRQAVDKNAGILINLPSVHMAANAEERRVLTTFWMEQDTLRSFYGNLCFNTVRNRALDYPFADKFFEEHQCDEAVVIAAGPSLSSRMDDLRNSKGKKKLIAVGTVYRKLLEDGIEPDCVVIIDPKTEMIDQIDGIEESEIPLLLDENVYWKIPRYYNGPCYFMKDVTYAGTVSSAAIGVAIRMGARKIYLVGLDLAYPGKQSHVDGAVSNEILDEARLFPIRSMDGGEVLTDTHMAYYINVIEDQISENEDIEFYNLSEHGALLRGTIQG